MEVRIIELSYFKKIANQCMDEEEKRVLHSYLVKHPRKGVVIRGTGGARKMRWACGKKGKRGGARIVYFYHVVGSVIYLISCYEKSKKTDLTHIEKKYLNIIVNQIKEGHYG